MCRFRFTGAEARGGLAAHESARFVQFALRPNSRANLLISFSPDATSEWDGQDQAASEPDKRGVQNRARSRGRCRRRPRPRAITQHGEYSSDDGPTQPSSNEVPAHGSQKGGNDQSQGNRSIWF